MSWIKNKYGEVVEDIKESRAAASITKKRTKAEYYRAREKQQLELARKKALFQRQQQERQLKAKYAPRPARTIGTATPTQTSTSPGFMSWNQSSAMAPSYFAPASSKVKVVPKIMKKRKKKSKRKGKKKSATKYIIKGGVAYPVG